MRRSYRRAEQGENRIANDCLLLRALSCPKGAKPPSLISLHIVGVTAAIMSQERRLVEEERWESGAQLGHWAGGGHHRQNRQGKRSKDYHRGQKKLQRVGISIKKTKKFTKTSKEEKSSTESPPEHKKQTSKSPRAKPLIKKIIAHRRATKAERKMPTLFTSSRFSPSASPRPTLSRTLLGPGCGKHEG